MSEQKTDLQPTPSAKALIPFIVFVAFFMGSGIFLGVRGVDRPFTHLPAVMCAYLASIAAFFITKGNIGDKMKMFLAGMGRSNILIMAVIYLLAGGFATITRTIGGVNSVVNAGLSVMPSGFVAVGVFLVCCAISFASGTSVGTITVLAPIGISMAERTGVPMGVVLGAVLSGAMFGNNLSLISDCTIAATNTQGVDMRDKTIINATLGLPAFLISCILFAVLGQPESLTEIVAGEFNLILILPYIVVLVTALSGISVVVCLTLGIFTSGILGLAYGVFNPLTMCQEIVAGFGSMSNMLALALLIGGFAYMVELGGGIAFIISKIQKFIKSQKSAQVAIAALTSLVACCVANDTVTIIISGTISKNISKEYRLDPRKVATIIPVIATTMVVLIPYSGATLTLTGIAAGENLAITVLDTIPYTFYPLLISLFTIISIFFPFSDRVLKKRPWDHENECLASETAEKKSASTVN